jgi:hypothetical protein
MRKLTLGVIAFYLQILTAYSQTKPADTTGYAVRKLKLSEVNLVSSYYSQDGDHSAVTGGIGTEKLTDNGNTIELKLIRSDRFNHQHNIQLQAELSHYTSASSDKIDPQTISSASYADTRFSPSLGYSITNPASGVTVGATLSYSKESDYISRGIGVNFAKSSKDNNREFGVKLQAYLDRWTVFIPVELRSRYRDLSTSEPRNSYSASFTFSQIVNPRLQYTLLADIAAQEGLLGTSFHRVYFKNDVVDFEHLPESRLKLPIGIKANYFLGDRFILRSSYRYYMDNWGVRAHTAELETPVKLNPYLSISPFYRFYSQQAANYFAGYKMHDPSASYFTSDYDLSKFTSQFFGTGIRYTPEKGVLGIKQWSLVELRYGHYNRSNGLNSNIFSMNLRFR